MRKKGKPHGKTPPQITMHKNNKNEKEQKEVAKQLCPSLQEDLANVQVCVH
jgi:hypothetical protein